MARKQKETTGSVKGARWIRIWDLPVRLFHWAFATCFLLAWFTQGDQDLYFHLLWGWLFAALLLFRLYWGFAGERFDRFPAFVRGVSGVSAYLKALVRGKAVRHLGHNPAGGWAIVAMLGLGGAIVITGVFTLGAEERHGPLPGIFDFSMGNAFHQIHQWLAWTLLVLVGIHVAGVLVESLIHRENLPLAMITGRKRAEAGNTVADVRRRPGVAALVTLMLLTVSVWWLGDWIRHDEGQGPFVPFRGPELVQDPVWQEECGGCHLAYHPSLLPRRSWDALLSGQEDHFDEDLALDKETIDRLSAFASANSAERTQTEAAWKISRSIPIGTAPLRITETGYWRDKHADIADAVWRLDSVNGEANCDACHLDAGEGWFEDGAMRLPPAGGE